MTVVEIVLLGVAALGICWAAVLVHEAGHYAAGRLIGVTAGSIRIRLERPPHVALRRGDAWLSPDDPEYNSTFAQHKSSGAAAWLFIAAGFLVEAVVALTVAAVLFSIGSLPLVIVGASTAVLIVYVASDVVVSTSSGRPYGDFTAMWRISAVASMAALAVMLFLRAAAIFWLL